MREHIGLFRGKRIDNGEWVEGYLLRSKIKGKIRYEIYAPFTEKEEKENEGHIFSAVGGIWHEVDPDTIGECTGLKDKNGKLIFEGDIYQYFDDEIQIVEWDDELHNIGLHTLGEREVKKGRKTEKRKFEGWNALWDFPLEEMEYLGTVHDNPELLKGGEGE